MPENPLEQARFDHVDGAGNLVFSAGGLRFAVTVDDTLERAILEAKQIRSESQRSAQPQNVSTLPISQIQSLIRAGADPARVAERYNLSEALVRRFSSAVETEKQYAIEQFLIVPAPKESHMRTVSELIERTLASARIGMETLNWQATRRGLEPWRITARFMSSGHAVRAEWTWNMHDNAVVCLNSAAKKLLGEQNLGAQGASLPTDEDDGFAIELNLPGDSIRSARIERAVSEWNMAQDAAPATGAAAGSSATVPSNGNPATPGTTGQTLPSIVAPTMPSAASENGEIVPRQPSEQLVSPTSVAADAPDTPSSADDAAHDDATASAAAPDNGHTDGVAASQPAQSAQNKPAKRRSGRSAVPTWDEILFGE
ncbi:septation protein SepH [Bifidobacterium biavatii]|uniref:DNA binding protein n=1 Tax=Bifidobacterium biavatii DSM 23969 TaxID=1437608 RepID=A0A086ZEK1_9BIFI|nr:septation protein SepH [Bifidobacterium biavatii]KFI44951.1 DNA binding protein [Bifidobacterium biavatii DSM 23969]